MALRQTSWQRKSRQACPQYNPLAVWNKKVLGCHFPPKCYTPSNKSRKRSKTRTTIQNENHAAMQNGNHGSKRQSRIETIQVQRGTLVPPKPVSTAALECKAKGSNPRGRQLENYWQIFNPDPRQVKASESFPKDHAPPKVRPMSIAGLTTGADGR